MPVNKTNFQTIKQQCDEHNAILVAVSKIKPAADIEVLYALGQRDFGENYVQELLEKEALLPKDIHWHFIGHLQSNKVKYIAPFVYLIHGVDSEKLLKEINKQGKKLDQKIKCLLQMHIASEDTKFGFDEAELESLDLEKYPFAEVVGFMGMASFSDDNNQVRKEFVGLRTLHARYQKEHAEINTLSMGMSGDYKIALEEGSNMIRIGSLLFGARL